MLSMERTGSILIAAALLGIHAIAACGGQADPAASQSASSDHPGPCLVQATAAEAHTPGPTQDVLVTATCPPQSSAQEAPAAILDVPATNNTCQRAERARMHLDEELAHARQIIAALEHANAELRQSLALEREQLDQMRQRLMYGRGIALQ